MRDYSVAGVRFGSLIGLTRGAWVGLPLIWGVLKLWLGAQGGVGTSCNLVLQYLVSGGEAPVLAAKTLVLRAIAGVGRGVGVGVEEGGGGGGNSISTPLRLRSAQLALHLGNELTRLFSFLDSSSEKMIKKTWVRSSLTGSNALL